MPTYCAVDDTTGQWPSCGCLVAFESWHRPDDSSCCASRTLKYFPLKPLLCMPYGLHTPCCGSRTRFPSYPPIDLRHLLVFVRLHRRAVHLTTAHQRPATSCTPIHLFCRPSAGLGPHALEYHAPIDSPTRPLSWGPCNRSQGQ